MKLFFELNFQASLLLPGYIAAEENISLDRFDEYSTAFCKFLFTVVT